MASFEWKGRDRAGRPQSGVLVADNKEAVLALLRRQQIVPTTVKERGKEIAVPRLRRGVDEKTLAVFTRQFSVMIDAGLPLVQCLQILGEQEEHKGFQRIITQVREDVEAGASLANAMRKHPQAFSDLYVNMVAAGEAGGILDNILQRLATYIEKNAKLKAQVKAALIYPAAVIAIAIQKWGGLLRHLSKNRSYRRRRNATNAVLTNTRKNMLGSGTAAAAVFAQFARTMSRSSLPTARLPDRSPGFPIAERIRAGGPPTYRVTGSARFNFSASK